MIKNIGDINKAIKSLKEDKNNAVSFIYENAKNDIGPLEKATVTIKDLFATIDAPTQASSQILKDFYPGYDATIVSKLRNAGAAILAKTHLDELALGGTGTFSSFGLIKNPLDNDRLVGGSSSGAISTFNESITISIGSDTGDSVRLPASYVGKVGFKPSYGAVSRYGMFAYASSLDTVGWFTHNVNDSFEAAKILFGVDEKDMTTRNVPITTLNKTKPTKVAFINNTELLSDVASNEYKRLKEKLIKDGIEIKEYTLDQELLDAIEIVYSIISFSEASSNDANLTGVHFGNRVEGKDYEEIMLNSRSKHLGKMVQRRFVLGAYYLLAENQEDMFMKAQKVRRLIVEMFSKLLWQNDVLVFPSAPIAPFIKEGKKDNWYTNYLAWQNFAGTPSISIPWIKEDGMPINLSIDSAKFTDNQLLNYALYFESLFGGAHE